MSRAADIRAVDGCLQDLLRVCQSLGIDALAVLVIDDKIVVRCHETGYVVPLCRRVLSEMEIPGDRTIQ